MLPGWKGSYSANSSPRFRSRDFERSPWCYLLWGAPTVLALVASSAYDQTALSAMGAGALWTVSVAWIGIGCFINARSCGRVHCMIDGILFPALSVVGALNVFAVISLSWNIFWTIFFVILIASFVAERIFGRYSRIGRI